MVRTKAKYWVVLLSAVFALAVGCAYGRHMDRGDQAYAAGDYTTAANAYEAALDEDPSSTEAADALARSRDALAGELTEDSKAALANKDWIGAVAAAARAHRQLPENQAVREAVKDVAREVAAKADSLEADGDFGNALLLMRAVADSLPPATPEYGPRADAMRARWVDQLVERGESAHATGHFGTALLYFGKASRLSPDPSLGGKRDKVRKELLDAWAYKVTLAPTGKRAKIATGMLAKRIEGTALRLGPKGPWPAADLDAVLRVEVESPKTRTARTSRIESVRYQSGTKQVKNPFYDSRLRDLESEEKNLTRVQNDVTRLESDVDRYRNNVASEGPSPNTSTGAEQNLSRALSSLERERDKLIRQRDRVQQARERLADEPQTKEEAVYSELDYEVETHTMTSTAAVGIEVEHADERKDIERRVVVAANASDTTHGAYPVAGVSANPLDLPSKSGLESTLLPEAAGAAGSAVEASFRSWRDEFLTRALAEPDRDTQADLLAIYVATDPQNVDPQVPVELKATTGIPDVVSSMRPGG
jgi:tetratricopeptide (TPR) repeat protein